MALFNSNHLKAVTLIENQTAKDKFQPIATGFLIGFLTENNPDITKRKYRLFLVTNRHVFNDFDQLWLRFNKKDKGTERFAIKLKENNEVKWLAHKDPNVDLAMLSINHNILNEKNVDWIFINEEMFAFPNKYSEIGIELGDEVFLLGFPMGISGKYQNYAIVRGGTIARFDEEIIKSEKSILLDATVFPGNSGGPVITKPELASLDGTRAVSSPYLIGVVSGYKLYKEPLYSHQSSPPSIAAISIENSGLASIVPMNFVKDIYKDFISSQKKLEKEVQAKDKIIEDKVEASSK
jgi:S1-C subfamily serine protease